VQFCGFFVVSMQLLFFTVLTVWIQPFEFFHGVGFFIIALLLVISALMSGSEVAYFSLSPAQLSDILEKGGKREQLLLSLLNQPDKLLAAILIGNNLVNVGVVVLFTYLNSTLFDFSMLPLTGFLVQVVVVTLILLLFGEIIPKIYANQVNRSFALKMALPLSFLVKAFQPVSFFLMASTKGLNRHLGARVQNLSMHDLSNALDLTSNQIQEEKQILEGIVRFGNIDVKDIMTPRMDVVGADLFLGYKKLLAIIVEAGYSRMPVFEHSIDEVKGVLYIKDLLPYLNEADDFQWQKLIRSPYFVPESKRINDLLTEFQSSKIHLAVVVDEYGGTSGIVTLEDVLEEIVGEITDELDEEEVQYSKLDERTFLFEGKTLISDFLRVMELPQEYFDDWRGDAETLAGLLLEIKGEFPQKNSEIDVDVFRFAVKSLDNKRIKQLKVIRL
jgi:putative hemolysin